MEKLIYTHQRNKYFYICKFCLLSFLFALSNFIALLNLWQIKFSLKDIFYQNVLEELKYLYNHITVFLMRDGFIFKEIETMADSSNTILLIFLFIFFLMSFFALRNKLKWLVFVLALPFAISVLATSYICSQNLLVVLIIAFLLIYKEISNEVYDLSKGREFFAIFLSGLLILGLINIDKVANVTIRSTFAEKIGNSVETKISKFWNGSLKFNEGEVFIGNRPIESHRIISKETDKQVDNKEIVALSIKTKEPKPMYLRGYVGEFFDGKKWQQLDPIIYRNSRGLMYWLDKSGFNGMGQIGQVYNLISDEKETKPLEINVVEARKNIIYTPYEMNKSKNSDFVDWYFAYFKEKGLLNISNYSFDINIDTAYDKWTELSAKLVLNQDDRRLEKYINAQSHYNTWIYDNYLALSKQDSLILKEIFGEVEEEEHLDYKKAIDNIRGFLDETFLYTEGKTISKNSKFSFLHEILSSKKAYDSQLATIAVLAFRHYKIPARYVEGYLITQNDIDDSKGKDIEIKSGNIHSWVEIYIDGVGFVPIEVSSVYRGVMPEADLAIGLENFQTNSKLIKKQDKLKGKSFEKRNDKEEQRSNGIENIVKILKITFLILFIILILLVALRPIFRILKKKHKERVFKGKDYKLASQYIFKTMKDERIKITETSLEIGNRAAYSKDAISYKERDEILSELKTNRKTNRKNLMKNKLRFLYRLYDERTKK